MKKLYLIILLIYTCSCHIYAQKAVTVDILQTSDTHSHIEPIEQVGDKYYKKGGFIRRLAMINQKRKTYPNLLLLDCGDFCQGTPYFNLYKGIVETDLMNMMKYDAGTIGNHEFDLGLYNMAQLFKRINYPIVCSNYNFNHTIIKNLVKPYIIIKKEGLRIGIFGLGPQPKGLIEEKNYKGVIFKDPIKTANQIAFMLRNKEKCDVIICLSHLGIEYDKILVPKTRNIDLLLGGHSHTFLKKALSVNDLDGKSVKIMHSGAYGVEVAETEIRLIKEK